MNHIVQILFFALAIANSVFSIFAGGGGDGTYLIMYVCNIPVSFLMHINIGFCLWAVLSSPIIYTLICIAIHALGRKTALLIYATFVILELFAWFFGLVFCYKFLQARVVFVYIPLTIFYLIPYFSINYILYKMIMGKFKQTRVVIDDQRGR